MGIHALHGDKGLGEYLEKMSGVHEMVDAASIANAKIPQLLADVTEMSKILGIKPPKVKMFKADRHTPMAAVYQTIAISPNTLEKHTSEEIREILWHEMGHIKHKDFRYYAEIWPLWVGKEHRADALSAEYGNPAVAAEIFKKYRQEGLEKAASTSLPEAGKFSLQFRQQYAADAPKRIRTYRRYCERGDSNYPSLNSRLRFFEKKAAEKNFTERVMVMADASERNR